ncbi:hypothetical protein G6F59_018296 [Rhizopus arrhizus]|nr:hypothetical protein G6F59_018296 [Rhizopus arrhizus]
MTHGADACRLGDGVGDRGGAACSQLFVADDVDAGRRFERGQAQQGAGRGMFEQGRRDRVAGYGNGRQRGDRGGLRVQRGREGERGPNGHAPLQDAMRPGGRNRHECSR